MKAAKRKPPASATAAFELKAWHVAAGALGAVLAAITVYQPALNGPFVFDDQYLPFYQPGFSEKPMIQAIAGVRPLLMLSFWLNQRISGFEPASYHLFNVLFHAAAGLLVFLIIRRVAGWAGEQGGRREVLAAFGGAVFLLHPIQTEAVAYVASRSENLSVLFFHAALALFMYRGSQAVSWPVAAGVLLLYGAAASTKEHTVVLPALLLLTDYFWNPGFSFSGIRRNWRLYTLVAAAGLAALRWVWKILGEAQTAGFGMAGLTWDRYFYTQCRALWQYFCMFVIPLGQNADYDYPISRTLLDRGAVIGLAALLVLVAGAIRFRRRFPLASYGVLAALLLFAPTSSFVPIRDTLAERRLYLPMIGLLLVPLEFLRRSKANTIRLSAVLAAILLAAGVLTYRRCLVWSSETALWEDVVAKSPENGRARFQLGMASYAEGRCSDAIEQYRAAAGIHKPGYTLLLDWGLAEDCLGRPEAALAKLREAAALERTAHVYSLIGMIYGKTGRAAESLEAIETALGIDPGYDMAYFYRGNLRASAGDWASAAEDYRQAVRLNPHNEVARQALVRAETNLRLRK